MGGILLGWEPRVSIVLAKWMMCMCVSYLLGEEVEFVGGNASYRLNFYFFFESDFSSYLSDGKYPDNQIIRK